MSDAEYFLNRVLPLPPLGDPNAYFSIHWRYYSKNAGKYVLAGEVFQDVPSMLTMANAKTYDRRGGNDVYFCTASQRTYEVTQQGNLQQKRAVRRINNVVHQRSLFMDLDVKGTTYTTVEDSMNAFMQFLKVTKLPLPNVIVRSGPGGHHIYWVLDEVLKPADWQPLANALAEATKKHDLKVDTACTVDLVRVLRVPGTFNFKAAPAHPVTLLKSSYNTKDIPVQTMRDALAPYMSEASRLGAPVRDFGEIQSELAAGILSAQARPVLLETIKPQCGFIREALDTGGANFTYPLWNLTTLIATFAEDGFNYAHKMAAGHSSYTQQGTSDFFTLKQQERADGRIGWPKCNSISTAGCTHCATCPHFAAGKSPLNLGQSAPTVYINTSDLPRGYVRDDRNRVHRSVQDDQGQWTKVQVTSYPFLNGYFVEQMKALKFDTYTSKPTSILLPVEDMNADAWLKTVGKYGMAISPPERNGIKGFLMDWVKQLQTIADRVTNLYPYGWVHNGNAIGGFCYGGKMFVNDTFQEAGHPDNGLALAYAPTGDLDLWKTIATYITLQGKPELDAILAMSFGSPLLTFTGHEGAVLSAFSSESGVGKTTAVKIACAVWGHPVKALQGLDDTQNAVLNKVGKLQNLPMYWDEVKTDQEIKNSVDLVFRISSGKEKSRLTSTVEHRESGSWQTLMCITSNNSLLDHVSAATKNTSAGAYRVFEFEVPSVGKYDIGLSAGTVSREVAKLQQNYGNAGLVYAQYLTTHLADVRAAVGKTQDAFAAHLNATHNERFWIATMACLFCGAHFANQAELTSFDMIGLRDFLFAKFKQMRSVNSTSLNDIKAKSSMADLMENFFASQRARNTIVVRDSRTGLPGKPGHKEPILSDVTRLENITVQVVVGRGVMHISRAKLREWLFDRKHSPTIVLKELMAQWQAREIRGSLGAGTVKTGAQEYLYEIDIVGGPAAAFVGSILDPYM